MKKRLRKKFRLREFHEDCFEVAFEIDPSLDDEQIDTMTDAFISMIEENNLQFGAGGRSNWSGIVQGPWRGSATDGDRETVLNWLRDHPCVVNASAGPLRDAWHGWA